jgi:hypothetical protein
MDALRSVLKRLEPPVAVEDSWEKVAVENVFKIFGFTN